MSKGLGKRQRAWLKVMARRETWTPGCGITWDNDSGTKLICDTLVEKEFLTKDPEDQHHCRYRVTEKGKQAAHMLEMHDAWGHHAD